MQRLDVPDANRDALRRPGVGPRFWRRQFSDDATKPQLIFDVAFGLLLPPLCFLFDPIVFNSGILGPPLYSWLPQYKALVYVFSALSILTLALWLVRGSRGVVPSGGVAGVLLSGAVCSLLIGVIILPISLFGLLVLVGALGFIPFFTSFVYLRNGVRALNASKARSARPTPAALLLLGAVLSVGTSLLEHWHISRTVGRSMNDLLHGDARSVESAARRLRYLSWAADLDQMVLAYSKETNQAKKEALERAYREMTGREIKIRLAILLD